MSLILNPKSPAAEDYHVLESGSRIGRIYKRKAAIRAEAQWLWILDSMSGGHDGIGVTGLAATLDEAIAALQGCRTKVK
jgi:hypothetical protein